MNIYVGTIVILALVYIVVDGLKYFRGGRNG